MDSQGNQRYGIQPTGSIRYGLTVYKTTLWNSWDELALYKGLYRRPGETNTTFRRRILAVKNYNSSKQGMVNAISDYCDATKYNVKGTKVFHSTYTPLSYIRYSGLSDKSVDYIPPQLYVGSVLIKFPLDIHDIDLVPVEFDGYVGILRNKYSYNFEKTVVWDPTITYTWTLWKNQDQSYQNIWDCSIVPPYNLKLVYQTIIDDEIYLIEETPYKLTRADNGDIEEAL